MPGRIIAAKDLFLNGDKSLAVLESSPDAAFLLIRKGREVPREYEALVTARGNPKQPAKPKGEARAKATKEVKPGGDK